MSTAQESAHQQAEREQLVRLTAQKILFRNLRGVAQRRRRWWGATAWPVAPAWPGIGLDLTGALLLEFSLAECQLDHANFTGTQFSGEASFNSTGVAHGIPLQPWRVFSEAAYSDLFRARLRALEFRLVCPRGWTIRAAQRRFGEDLVFMYLAEVKEGYPWGT